MKMKMLHIVKFIVKIQSIDELKAHYAQLTFDSLRNAISKVKLMTG